MLSGFTVKFTVHTQYCSAVWCSAADTRLILLDREVSDASFLTGGVFWVLPCSSPISGSIMYAIRSGVTQCTLFMVLYLCRMCRCGLHAALIAHRYAYAPPRCRTSNYSRTIVPLSVFLWNDLGEPVFDGVGLVGFKSRANALFLA